MKKVLRKTFFYIILCLFTLIFLYPILYTFYNSIVPLGDVGRLVPPSHWTAENYQILFTQYPVIRWLLNTVIVTLACTVGQLIVNTMAGYAIARFDFPGRKIIFTIVLCSMMVPFPFIITPMYINLAKMGLNNTLWALIIPFMYNTLYIFMARQFFIGMPQELEDAARVDGLSYAGTFLKVMLPNSKPLITSITILTFTGTWNSYLAPSTFMVTKEKFVLSVGLKTVKDFQFAKMNLTLAGVVVLSLPILIMFLCLQKQFVEGVVTSGIKG